MSDNPRHDAFLSELRRLVMRKNVTWRQLAYEAHINELTLARIVSGRTFPAEHMLAALRAALTQDHQEGVGLTLLYEQARAEWRGLARQALQAQEDRAVQLTTDAATTRAHMLGADSVAGGSAVGTTALQGAVIVTGRSRTPSGPAPDPILYSTAAEFVAGLNSVHVWAMEPSLRDLERRSLAVTGRRCARSTLSDMLTSEKLPRWDLALAFLELCGVQDTETWGFVWRRIRAAERTTRRAG